MRQRIEHIAKAATAALVIVAGLLVAPASPAQAATMPPLKYTAPQLGSDLGYTPRIISQTDGGVTVGGCGSGGGNTDGFRQYGATGSLVQSKPLTVSNRSLYTCTNQSAVGSDGTVYTAAYDPATNKEVLIAFQGGTQKWVYVQPCSSIVDVQVGTNGNIYMLVRDGNGCSGYPKLVGVEPELANGQGSPTVVANTQIQRNLPNNGGLSPYSGGLVVRFTDGVGFYSHTGVLNTTAPGWNLPIGYYDGGPFTTADTGRAFVPERADQNTIQQCNNDNTVISAITALEPSGVAWSASLPTCSRVGMMRPLHTGGVVALVSSPVGGWPSSQYATKLYAISSTGGSSPMWAEEPSSYVQPAPAEYNYSQFSFVADTSGNVVLVWQFTKRDTNNVNYPGVKVTSIGGFTGAPLASIEVSGGMPDGHGFSVPGGHELIPALGNSVIFLPLAECTYSCNYSTTKLYAAKMPGITLDYPRGAVLDNGAAWKNYVAMGDSFSSGEGVPLFASGSDTAGPPENRCHRSNSAYGKMASGNPALRLTMTTFAACSGATSEYALYGWPGGTNGQNGNEGKQVDALSTTTKVVTLTMGGNDIGFGRFVIACLFEDCGDTAVNGGFFTAINNMAGSATSTQQNPQGTGLLGLYSTIADEASNANVYVMGYPQMLSQAGCSQTDRWMAAFNTVVSGAHLEWELDDFGPASTTLHAIGVAGGITAEKIEALREAGAFEFNASEVAAARTLVSELNEKIETTVGSLNNPNFKYVDPLAAGSPFIGHELCTSQPFFNGLDVTNQPYSFHPNALGQDAYRQLLVANF